MNAQAKVRLEINLDKAKALGLRFCAERNARQCSTQDIADLVGLSRRQLERLFSGQLGLSVRRLVLWQRLRVALHLALSGASLTEAALLAEQCRLALCNEPLQWQQQQISISASFGVVAGPAPAELETLLQSADENTTGPAHIVLQDPDGNQIMLDQHR